MPLKNQTKTPLNDGNKVQVFTYFPPLMSGESATSLNFTTKYLAVLPPGLNPSQQHN